jgi:hypothetical protein
MMHTYVQGLIMHGTLSQLVMLGVQTITVYVVIMRFATLLVLPSHL